MTPTPDWLTEVHFDTQGLLPAIAQDAGSQKILMVAWMNRDALLRSVETGEAVYWSRSRQKLWHKGEESGHRQVIREIRLDCDSDVIVLQVEQMGGIACHTGRQTCFFRVLRDNQWQTVEPVIKSPTEIYS